MPADTALHAPADTRPAGPAAVAAAPAPLQRHWARTHAIVNLRGDPGDAAFTSAVGAALGVPLPQRAGECPATATRRIVWAGPDDWFVIGEPGEQAALAAALRAAGAGTHHAVTDVSSGYAVLTLAGPSAQDVLAQGCPLDLHLRAFPVGCSAGTHFFKASVWMWRTGADRFELLVRTSFAGYVETLLRACTRECGMEPPLPG